VPQCFTFFLVFFSVRLLYIWINILPFFVDSDSLVIQTANWSLEKCWFDGVSRNVEWFQLVTVSYTQIILFKNKKFRLLQKLQIASVFKVFWVTKTVSHNTV